MHEGGEAFVLVAVTLAYAVPALRSTAAQRRGHAPTTLGLAPLLGGMARLAAALGSPPPGAAARRLSPLMAQHLLLVSVAAPLLVAGRPFALIPGRWRARWPWGQRRPDRPLDHATAWLALAVGLHVGVLLAWHLPVLYQAALDHDTVHGLEHVSMLVSALAAWAALTGLGRAVPPFAVLVLFLATLAMTALGFAMMIARTPWYAPYARRSGALGDQQLAGVLMWGYGGGAAGVGGVLLFVAWLRQAERGTPARAVAPVPEEAVR